MTEFKGKTEELAHSWVANADAWVAAVRSGTIESRRLITDRAIFEAVMGRHPKRVLDVGCGEGWLVHALTEVGVESVGVDGSLPLIKAAQEGGGGKFHVCSYADLIANLDRIGSGFDVITVNFALLDAADSALLPFLKPRLSAGGALVLQTVHPWGVGGDYSDGWREENFKSFDGVWEPMPWYFRTLESWVNVLRESGYSITSLHEPKHPDTQVPLSLLFVAQVKEEDNHSPQRAPMVSVSGVCPSTKNEGSGCDE